MKTVFSMILNVVLIAGVMQQCNLFAQAADSRENTPTSSRKIHPDRAAQSAQKSPDNHPDGAPTQQKQEKEYGEELKDSGSIFSAWWMVPVAVILLALVFMRLSTAPSRDPSRNPR